MKELEGIRGRRKLAVLSAMVVAVVVLVTLTQRTDAQAAPAADGPRPAGGQGELGRDTAAPAPAVGARSVDATTAATAVDACDDTQGGCANLAYWKPTQNPSTGDWDIMLSDDRGAYARVKFKGTSIKWITAKSPAGGTTTVYLDGKKVKVFDAYDSSVRLDQVGYSKKGLANKKHDLFLVTTSTNPSSGGYKTFIDEFKVGSAAYQQDDYRVAYGVDFEGEFGPVSGAWVGISNPRAYGGSYRVSDSTTAPAVFYFPKGPEIGIKTVVGPIYGEMYVAVMEYDPATGNQTYVGSAIFDTHAAELGLVTRTLTSVTDNAGVERTLDPNKQYGVYAYSNIGDLVAIDGWTGDLP